MNLKEQKLRIICGEIYNDLTDELVDARKEAVVLTNEYNDSYGQKPEVRETILKKLFADVGEGTLLEPGFRCEFGFNITVGKNFYANFGAVLLDPAPIIIGGNVLFDPRVSIYTARHAYDPEERAECPGIFIYL